MFLGTAAIWLALSLAAAPVHAPSHTLFKDDQQGYEVKYAFTPSAVEFSSNLPAGWSFMVKVDGNQDGAWGDGPKGLKFTRRTTVDRAFGQDSRNGIFCSQYIYSSFEDDPSRVFASSECGVMPSKGYVAMSGLDKSTRATITLHIPAAEVFGKFKEARLQICVWDTKQVVCHYTPRDPFVLRSPG